MSARHAIAVIYKASVLTLSLLVASCGSTELSRDRGTPGYVQSADNYRAFASSADLALYLRHGSGAGPLISAHRGGAIGRYPENCIGTMDRMLQEAAALFEVDVRMTADSVLVLLHDETLDRTTSGKGNVARERLSDLRRLLLRDSEGVLTPFRIPTLAEVLAWAEGRAVLTLDIKEGVSPSVVVRAVRLAAAENRVVIIAYSIEQLREYLAIAPDLNYSATAETLEDARRLVSNISDLSRLIVWTGLDSVDNSVIELLHDHGLRAIVGTFGQTDQLADQVGVEAYDFILQSGTDIIATDRVSLVALAMERFEKVQGR